jgi:hypothetical protein
MQEEKVTAESLAGWLRELGYRAPDGSLPTRSTVSSVAHVAPDMLQFLMERFRSKGKAQRIRQYLSLLDASSDPNKVETLKRLNETAKLNLALKEASNRREAKAEQYAQGVVRRPQLPCPPASQPRPGAAAAAAAAPPTAPGPRLLQEAMHRELRGLVEVYAVAQLQQQERSDYHLEVGAAAPPARRGAAASALQLWLSPAAVSCPSVHQPSAKPEAATLSVATEGRPPPCSLYSCTCCRSQPEKATSSQGPGRASAAGPQHPGLAASAELAARQCLPSPSARRPAPHAPALPPAPPRPQACSLGAFSERCAQLAPMLRGARRELAALQQLAEARIAAGRPRFQPLGSPLKGGWVGVAMLLPARPALQASPTAPPLAFCFTSLRKRRHPGTALPQKGAALSQICCCCWRWLQQQQQQQMALMTFWGHVTIAASKLPASLPPCCRLRPGRQRGSAQQGGAAGAAADDGAGGPRAPGGGVNGRRAARCVCRGSRGGAGTMAPANLTGQLWQCRGERME